MFNNNVNNGLQQAVTVREAGHRPADKPEPEVIEKTAQPKQEQAEAKPQELLSAVSKLNDYVQNIQRTLSFRVEEDTGITVVKVFDSETDELIRQIPTEETIKFAASIEAHSGNLLFQEQA